MTGDKIKVFAFVPLSVCSCSYQDFLDRAWEVMIPYKKNLIFDVKDVSSPEGDELGIFQNTIVVASEGTKFTSIDKFKQYLDARFMQ